MASTNVADGGSTTDDITTSAFAIRLAGLLTQRRRELGLSRRRLARGSAGAFTAKRLKELESGGMKLTDTEVDRLAELYGIDLAEIGADRVGIEIEPFGVISAADISTTFVPGDATSLLTNYLRLVRRMRGDDRPAPVELRRRDIDVLAHYLGESGEAVVERLGALMGATQVQCRTMVGVFTAGALVIDPAGRDVPTEATWPTAP
jgi:transcriptional regulator with XRE-family HTH domain